MVNKKIGSLGKFIVLFGMIGGAIKSETLYDDDNDNRNDDNLISSKDLLEKLRGALTYKKEMEMNEEIPEALIWKISTKVKSYNDSNEAQFLKFVRELPNNEVTMKKLIEQILGPQKTDSSNVFNFFIENISELIKKLEVNEEENKVNQPASEIIKENSLPIGVGPFGANPSSLDSYQRRMMEALLKMTKQ